MFSGTYTALITPFKDSSNYEVDFDTYSELLEWQLSVGVDGIVVCGTTGESATLTYEEEIDLVKRSIEVVAGRVPIIVGTGSNSTRDAVAHTKRVSALGVDGALVVSPYYNKPTQEGLLFHFESVAKEGGLPVVVYNIPGRTGIEISLDTFSKLAEIENIVAVKQAVDSASKLVELSAIVNGKMALLAGDDALTYLVLACGGAGVISASASVIPEQMLAITNAAKEGNLKKAYQAQIEALPYIDSLFVETNPAPAKAALKFLGRISSDTLRPPLVSVRESTRAEIEKVFGEFT